jgi:hypothetical protein
MGTRLSISSAYHPQTDGQSKRTIQNLKDMLRACIIDFGGILDSHVPLVDFTYNNSYHAIIGMAPYEALYGRRCKHPYVGEKKVRRKSEGMRWSERPLRNSKWRKPI